jgi:hypothetical protein
MPIRAVPGRACQAVLHRFQVVFHECKEHPPAQEIQAQNSLSQFPECLIMFFHDL